MKPLIHRKATLSDLPSIIDLLLEDEFGKMRETLGDNTTYLQAFKKIDEDSNHYLMVVEWGGEIVATCHLTLLPSLTFSGKTRLQIEAVRVSEKYRGQRIGEWMMTAAIEYGKKNGALITQLTTHKKRTRAQTFYEKLGFRATHEGMKLF